MTALEGTVAIVTGEGTGSGRSTAPTIQRDMSVDIAVVAEVGAP